MTELEKLELDIKLLSPLKYYKDELKEKFDTEIKNLFEELHKKSKVDENENRKLVKEYEKRLEEEKKQENKLKILKFLNIFCLIVMGISFIYTVYILLNIRTNNDKVNILIGIVLGLISGSISFGFLRKKIIKFKEVIEELSKKVSEKYAECMKQIYPLLNLFESNISAKIISEIFPSMEVDNNFKIERYAQLVNQFSFKKYNANNISVAQLLSGEILGNPFVIMKNKINRVIDYTYHGSRTIYWTEYRTNSEGKRESISRSETLRASVVKPKQIFEKRVELFYANDAADNLNFSRKPNNTHEKGAIGTKINNFFAKRDIKKKNKEALKEGKNFVEMSNEEFDILFKALDRDNEVDFRVLFTPIAQKNMIDLLKDATFGDDFYFKKMKKINLISNNKDWNINIDREKYYHHSFDVVKKKFIEMNKEYFYYFYKIFLPIFSIPVYQQHKSLNYIYGDNYYYNYNSYLSEYFANSLGERQFLNSQSDTEGILKTKTEMVKGKTDLIKVEAKSYKIVQRVDYIPKYCSDGHWYDVPVYWDDYIPLENTSSFEMRKLDMNELEFDNLKFGEDDNIRKIMEENMNNYVFKNNIFAVLTNNENIIYEDKLKELDKINKINKINKKN